MIVEIDADIGTAEFVVVDRILMPKDFAVNSIDRHVTRLPLRGLRCCGGNQRQ